MSVTGSRVRMAIVLFAAAVFLPAQEEPKLSDEQIREFLLNAKVVAVKNAPKGVTRPPRLTLTDGTLTHDASFQSVNEEKPMERFTNGTREVGFRDCYKYNIAAYELARMLGLGDMMPVTVERKWDEKTGSLSWWLPVMMDEATRAERKVFPPDAQAWNRQMYKKRIFAELVYDSDPNMTNVLISKDWHIWMIDFTRAFRLRNTLRDPQNILQSKCERTLFSKLRGLTKKDLAATTGRYLTPNEIAGVIARRDKIVSLIEQMIARQGEKEVLYEEAREGRL